MTGEQSKANQTGSSLLMRVFPVFLGLGIKCVPPPFLSFIGSVSSWRKSPVCGHSVEIQHVYTCLYCAPYWIFAFALAAVLRLAAAKRTPILFVELSYIRYHCCRWWSRFWTETVNDYGGPQISGSSLSSVSDPCIASFELVVVRQFIPFLKIRLGPVHSSN